MNNKTETTLYRTEVTQQKQDTTHNSYIFIRCHFGPLLVFASCIGVRTLHVTIAVRCLPVFVSAPSLCSSLLTMPKRFQCAVCGEDIFKGDQCMSWRCAGSKFRVRMHRALNEFKNGTDPSIVTDFNNLSAEDKEKFKRANHSTLGPHLKMAIYNLVKVTRKTEILNKAVAKGHMKDEHDLKVKYGRKPEQLNAILAKSYNFTCPVRNCKLWADPDFITEWNLSHLEDTQETITFKTDDLRKEIKKQKTEPAPPVPGDEKALKKADLAKLRVLFDAIKE